MGVRSDVEGCGPGVVEFGFGDPDGLVRDGGFQGAMNGIRWPIRM